MNKIGRRIFYDTFTGNVIFDTGEMQGSVKTKTIVQDIETVTILSERNRESFDHIELEYGQYTQDFAECNGYRVNPETKELEFSYPDPNEPEVEQSYQVPLSEKVLSLESQNESMMLALAELAEVQEEDKITTQLALAEIAELVAGGA